MNRSKNIELFHNSGKCYRIVDVPVFYEDFLILTYYLEMMINDIEKLSNPKSKYSFLSFIIQKYGLKEYAQLLKMNEGSGTTVSAM
ncbi:DUF2535 family protein [Alkalihalobacillus sp. LMS39]|uniref:DUF2535 family protein n=1 Tax=Alkalihalobacillus sp. LMS39 TaxID=2924032 RepID=UPI001FB26CAC|nr:DUF2535 family protein [Alkalihalobacillus sp. LMS39]UOE93110.1 DUF2535 family protein [Alkalihalobacillus sp. LMS39]